MNGLELRLHYDTIYDLYGKTSEEIPECRHMMVIRCQVNDEWKKSLKNAQTGIIGKTTAKAAQKSLEKQMAKI